jgi:hypothetical protein
VPYRRFRDAAAKTWRHVDFHLDRGVKGDLLKPSLTWLHVRGLALSSRQTYDAIALLLADRNKPNTLPLQAAILTRSLLEGLGNIMALTSSPSAIRWFLADGYRETSRQIAVQQMRFGNRERWKGWLSQMQAMLVAEAEMIGLSERRTRNPVKTIPDWPSPYWLSRPKRVRGRKTPLPVLLRGNRARLFEDAHQLWYSELSSFAHQRSAAARMAIFSNDPDAHWEPGRLESNVISEGLLFYTCIMSELEAATSMPPSADLRALWTMLCDLDEHAKEFVRIRYRRLLRLPLNKVK